MSLEIASKYDRIAERFAESSYANVAFDMQHRFRLTMSWGVSLLPGDSVLELGCGDGYLAQVESDPGSWEAKLYFRPDFADQEPPQVRETVVHELLHVHRRPIIHLNDSALREFLGAYKWNTWLAAHELLDEQATEAVALAVAPYMPEFPGWPGAKP
jgi:hypothetical protein